jgi:hypothetical protein
MENTGFLNSCLAALKLVIHVKEMYFLLLRSEIHADSFNYFFTVHKQETVNKRILQSRVVLRYRMGTKGLRAF